MRRKKTVSMLVVLALLTVMLVVSVQPVFACLQGCTPGFWKQEQWFGYWTGPYVPDETLVGDVFADASTYFPDLADDTLLEALDYPGGPSKEGAASILLRAASAMLLNSAYDDAHGGDWWYSWWTPELIKDTVNARLVLDRASMLSLAEVFDDFNNLGCPLGRSD